jgi:hypothetical protein
MNTSIRNHSNRLDSKLPLHSENGGQQSNEGATKQGASIAANTTAVIYQQSSSKIGRRYSFDDNGGGYQGL